VIDFEGTNAMTDEIAASRAWVEACAGRFELAAKLTPPFAEYRERFGHGTVPGDSLTIVGKQTTPIEAACGRLASALGLNIRQRLRPQAIRALRSIAKHERLAELKIQLKEKLK
jgi:hypothetical protein